MLVVNANEELQNNLSNENVSVNNLNTFALEENSTNYTNSINENTSQNLEETAAFNNTDITSNSTEENISQQEINFENNSIIADAVNLSNSNGEYNNETVYNVNQENSTLNSSLEASFVINSSMGEIINQSTNEENYTYRSAQSFTQENDQTASNEVNKAATASFGIYLQIVG